METTWEVLKARCGRRDVNRQWPDEMNRTGFNRRPQLVRSRVYDKQDDEQNLS